jgi:predicted Rossmann fold nucleotide-binding protein DprA/Smf involved in DNA uptake
MTHEAHSRVLCPFMAARGFGFGKVNVVGEVNDMRIAIVGSREYRAHIKDKGERWKPIFTYIWTLPMDTVIVSGGAAGVDGAAEFAARSRQLVVDIYPADWDTYGKSAGMRRNNLIVNAADKVVAFYDGTSKGTADTIAKARKAGKPVVIIGEDGVMPPK